MFQKDPDENSGRRYKLADQSPISNSLLPLLPLLKSPYFLEMASETALANEI